MTIRCLVLSRMTATAVALSMVAVGALTGCSPQNGATAPSFTTVRTSTQPFKAEQDQSDSFTTGISPVVTVDLFSGPIIVKPSGEVGVKVSLTKRAGGETQAEAEENLKYIDLEVQQDADKVNVTARQNDDDFTGFLEVATEMEVPPGTVLDLRNGFGPVTVSSVGDTVTIHASNGPITVEQGVGELNLTSAFGNVSVDGEHTKVKVKVGNGQVTVVGAKGPVDVGSDYGAIEIRSAAGVVNVTGINGAIKIAGGPGPMELTTAFGDIEISADHAPVTAKTANGKITLTGGDGGVNLQTDFGDIDVQKTAGAVRAHTTNGAVRVVDGKGPFDVSSEFGDITVDAMGAPITARTSNGKIVLRGGKGKIDARSNFGAVDLAAEQATVTAHSTNGSVGFTGTLLEGEHSFGTAFGDITLSLPADARFRLDAQTDFGRVTSGFEISRSESSTESHLIGTVGKDALASVKVRNSNGNIDVKRK